MPSASSSPKPDLVLLGRMGDAHGLKGEIKIVTFTAHPEDICAYGNLVTLDGAQSFELSQVRPIKDNVVIAKIKGVAERTAAEKLRGLDLYVPRANLPAAEEDEFYHSDLIGLTAQTLEGEAVGEVIAVHNFGAGDLLEIRLTGEKRTELVLFDDVNVPQVNLAQGTLTLAIDLKALQDDDDDSSKAE